MNDWDQEKLEEVVDKKHGESNKAKPKTSIVCIFFKILLFFITVCNTRHLFIISELIPNVMPGLGKEYTGLG